MEGALLTLIIVAPISLLIGWYQCSNNGRMPFIDTSTINNHNRVLPEN